MAYKFNADIEASGDITNPAGDKAIFVDSTTATNGQVLAWNDSSSKWEPADGGSGGAVGSQIFIPGRPQGTLERSYTFDSGLEGWTADGATLAQSSGKLSFSGASTNQTALEPVSVSNVSDGEVVVDMSFGTNTSNVGIVFRATDFNNHYMLSIRGDESTNASVQLYEKSAGTYTPITENATQSQSLSLGAGFTVRYLVRFVGSEISIYANDALIATAQDSTHSAGRVGFRIGSGGASLLADNIGVYSLPVSWEPDWDGGSVNVFEHNIMPEWRGFDIDVPKLTANTPDDDFTETTLDAKWNVVSGTAGTVSLTDSSSVSKYDLSSMPGTLLMQAGGDGSEIVSLRQDYSLPDGRSLIASFNPAMTFDGSVAVNQHYYKFTLNDNDTSTNSGNYVYLYMYTTGSYFYVGVYDGSTGVTTNSFVISPHNRILLRFARVGLTYRTFFSITDGKSWNPIWEKTAANAYTNVWLTAENNATHSHTPAIAGWDWLREGSNNVKPWESDPDQAIAYVRLPSTSLSGVQNIVKKSVTTGTTSYGTSWANVNTDLDITVDASAGDYIMAGVSLMWSNTSNQGLAKFVAVVNGSEVDFDDIGSSGDIISGFSADSSANFNGRLGNYPILIEESHIYNGQVTLRLKARSDFATTGLYITTSWPVQTWAWNSSRINVDGIDSDSGPVQLWEPDAPPINPNSYDVEYQTTDINDLEIWDPGSVLDKSYIGQDGSIHIEATSSGTGYELSGALSAAPTGDFAVSAKIGMDAVDNSGAGTVNRDVYLVIAEDIVSSPSTANILAAGFRVDDQDAVPPTFIFREFSDYATLGQGGHTITNFGRTYGYVRIVRQGNSYRAQVSNDGSAWLDSEDIITTTMTPAYIGIACTTISGAGTVGMSAKFVRVTTDTSLDSPLLGRRIAVNSGNSSETSYSIIPSWKGFEIDAPKATADSVDDEFDSDALAGKWTVVNGSAGSVDLLGGSTSVYDLTTQSEKMLVQLSGSASDNVVLRQDAAIPDGKSLVIKVGHSGLADSADAWANNEFGFGLYINNDDSSPSAGNYVSVGYDHSTNSNRVTSTASTGLIGEMPDQGGYAQLKTNYFRIARNGLEYFTFFSLDGNTWIPFGSATLPSATDNIWLYFNCSSAFGSPSPIVETEWIRLGDNSYTPWTTQPDAGVTIQGTSIRDRLWLPDQDNPLGLDDEFDDDSIASDWITVQGANPERWSVVEGGGLLSVKHATGDPGQYWRALVKPIGALTAPYYIESAIRIAAMNPNYITAGIVFSNGATHGSGKQVSQTLSLNTGATKYQQTREWNNWTSYVNQNAQTLFNAEATTVHLRLVYESANTFSGWWSIDGVQWTKFSSSLAVTLTPTHMGVMTSTYGSSVEGMFAFEYFRVRQGLPT